VIVHTRTHRPDDENVVHDSGGVWQQLRYFRAALSMLGEFPKAAQNLGTGPTDIVVLDLAGEFLAVHSRERWLGIEQIDLTWPALHEQANYRAGFWLVIRRPRLERKMPAVNIRLHRRGFKLLLL
jgi:hypothetical protein